MVGCTSVVENLLRSAARFPDNIAIQDASSRVTYTELLRRSLSFSAALRASGLERGDRVAIVLPNCVEFVAAFYGTLLAGGIAVLLNAAAKERDFSAWLKNCDARFVCGEPANREVTAALGKLEQKPVLLSLPAGAAHADQHVEPPLTGGDDAACILYTSGTTGEPKGVVLSHRNVSANTASIVDYLDLTHNDSSVVILPFYYSYGSSVLHTHLQVGARLILEKNFLYPHVVVETLSRERATGFAGVPSTFALLLSRVKLEDYDLGSLRYVTQAGGAMTPSLTQRLRAALPRTQILVMYGQTEATARLTYLSPERLDDKLGSVGRPVSGVELQIRRESGEQAEVEEIGEVWARGPNVMLGYWRNETATSEVKQGDWLKTGDMGRLDSEGFLYLVGRRSDMIKAGAHRIHPRDIEDVILELSEVHEVAVVGVDDDILGQSIKAFVVPAEGSNLTPMKIQAHCRERLASYKIPKVIEIVASLPRTASGKVKRAELSLRTNV